MQSNVAFIIVLALAISKAKCFDINNVKDIGMENFCKRNFNVQSIAAAECEFPHWGTKQAFPNDCRKYWFCGFNGWELETCSFDMYFNTFWSSCWPDASGCVYKTCEAGKKYALENPEFNCHRYIKCVANDTSTLEQCPSGTFFDVKTQNCTENAALCFPNSNNRCRKAPKHAVYAFPLDCSAFIVCNDEHETGKLEYCADQTFFDVKTKTCISDAFVCGGIQYQ